MKLIIHTDGASRGNPGEAGIGAVIENAENENETLYEIAEYVNKMTNNAAEYTAVIRALEKASELGGSEVLLLSDSELLVKQVNGEYRVKNAGLQPLYQKVFELKQQFKSFKIQHVRREQNKRADKLANMGIDQNLNG